MGLVTGGTCVLCSSEREVMRWVELTHLMIPTGTLVQRSQCQHSKAPGVCLLKVRGDNNYCLE